MPFQRTQSQSPSPLEEEERLPYVGVAELPVSSDPPGAWPWRRIDERRVWPGVGRAMMFERWRVGVGEWISPAFRLRSGDLSA